MATMDCLYIKTDLSINQTLHQFASYESNEVKIFIDTDPPRASYAKPNIADVSALRANYVMVPRVAEVAGFSPNIQILFTLYKWESWEVTRNSILEILIRFLLATTWDVAWRLGGIEIALVRREEQVYINKAIEFWTPERLALLSMPYTLTEIPYL